MQIRLFTCIPCEDVGAITAGPYLTRCDLMSHVLVEHPEEVERGGGRDVWWAWAHQKPRGKWKRNPCQHEQMEAGNSD